LARDGGERRDDSDVESRPWPRAGYRARGDDDDEKQGSGRRERPRFASAEREQQPADRDGE
jgi:hypothetical protein